MLELYSDYLLCSFSATTATGLSSLTDGVISHDKVTRFLGKEELNSCALWSLVKKEVRACESEDAVLIFDDTIEEKPYTDESELICWHYDHSKNRSVKGINILNAVYHSQGHTFPVAFEAVRKPYQYCDLATKKVKRKSERTKNEMMRDMLLVCRQNQLKFSYALFDIWFSSAENMDFIVKRMKRHFISAVKGNRLVALSEEDKKAGQFIHMSDLDYSEQKPLKVWVKGLSFPVLAHRQIFTNKDGSEGILYLMCSDLSCDKDRIEAIYKKRWNVEVYHKSLKQNANLAKSPAQRIRTQLNHVFMAIYSVFKLECLGMKRKMNHFAIRGKLLINATRSAYERLLSFQSA